MKREAERVYTIKDYVKWRGDLTFEQDRFNEVDNLVLCSLAYMNLDTVIKEIGKEEPTVREVGITFFKQLKCDKTEPQNIFFKEYLSIFRGMYRKKRFGTIRIRNYYGIMDKEKLIQFAAMEFVLPDNTPYIVFRGTDDSFIGWKEDMFISMEVIESEKEAFKYLERVLKQHDGPVRVGGHSKGANLAMYASLLTKGENQDRIIEIYNNDGPGFLDNILSEHWDNVGVIESKVKRYLPEESVVGMLLNNIGNPVIIKSNKSRIFQHTMTNWNVEGTKMVRAKEISAFSIKTQTVITEWLNSFEDKKKQEFFDDLFDALEATGAENFSNLQGGGVKSIQAVIKKLNHLNPETKEKMRLVLKEMILESNRKVPSLEGVKNSFS